jgi:uncharacterized protein YndB with AHSA1/START domain
MTSDVDASIVISRPIADVFAYVANFENHPQWEKNFRQVRRLSAGDDGVGTKYECVFKVPGQQVTATLEITGYEPERRIGFRADKPAMAKPVGEILFAPEGAGTRVTLRPRPEIGGPMRLIAPLMAGYIRRNNLSHLRLLKERLEQPAATS